MRSLVSNLFMSVDGVVESPGTWSLAYWNDDIAGVMADATEGADALLLGRVTYSEFEPAWSSRSTADDPGAEFFNTVRKHVATTTLDRLTWNNSVPLEGDVPTAVAALKEQDGGRIITSGSGSLVRTLLQAGLVDELRLLVYPVVVGAGKRLCECEDGQIPLALKHARSFDNGVTYAVYTGA
jgi:dihydrofolate reductase